MNDPKDRYINPDIGYYGQTTKIGDTCYVATGRTGDMTDFYEHKPPTFTLKDHKCPCIYFDMKASDHVSDSLQLGAGADLGFFDASTTRVDIESTDGIHYINLKHNRLESSKQFMPPTSYLFAGWFKMKATVFNGHPEINLWDHHTSGVGATRLGYKITLSSDATANDGLLSVLIGKNNAQESWNIYSVTDVDTWITNTSYHVAVLQVNTTLKIYVNGEKKLDVTTSSILSDDPASVSINTSTGSPPVSIERYTYMSTIPDLPETFINQHYNRTDPTPRNK